MEASFEKWSLLLIKMNCYILFRYCKDNTKYAILSIRIGVDSMIKQKQK